jgi:hypothetical protein
MTQNEDMIQYAIAFIMSDPEDRRGYPVHQNKERLMDHVQNVGYDPSDELKKFYRTRSKQNQEHSTSLLSNPFRMCSSRFPLFRKSALIESDG